MLRRESTGGTSALGALHRHVVGDRRSAEMKKFEHRMIRTGPTEALQHVLNAAGEDGWELCAAIADPAKGFFDGRVNCVCLFFQREKQELPKITDAWGPPSGPGYYIDKDCDGEPRLVELTDVGIWLTRSPTGWIVIDAPIRCARIHV